MARRTESNIIQYMSNLYNSILAVYTSRFSELKPKAQFHFASRLHLWCREPQAELWLKELRPAISSNNNPREAVKKLLQITPPALRVSGARRQPYFDRFPQLRLQERTLFRLLFLHTVYGFDTKNLFYEFFDAEAARAQYDSIVSDADALRALSSFGINYVYLLSRFVENNGVEVPVADILRIGRGYSLTDPLERHLQCYFYTHAIIAESLFYSRKLPSESRQLYMEMLLETERTIAGSFEETTLDAKYEYLVCCRLLDHISPLEEAILQETASSISPDGYIVDARVNMRRADTLHNAKHRNVLFLLSQKPFRPARG